MVHPVTSLLERVNRNPELQEKLEAILRQTGDTRIQSLVAFSTEAGVPVSPEEWACAVESSPEDAAALSDDDLADISGGLDLGFAKHYLDSIGYDLRIEHQRD